MSSGGLVVAEPSRVDIGAAGEDQAVDQVQHACRKVAEEGQDYGNAAGPVNGLRVRL